VLQPRRLITSAGENMAGGIWLEAV